MSAQEIKLTLRNLVHGDVAAVTALYARYTMSAIDLDRFGKHVGVLPGIVALANDKIIGFAYCYRFAPDILELANIHVAREVRSHRVGAKLIDGIVRSASPQTSAIIAVNSLLNDSLEEKRRPDGFYLSNGFRILFQNENTTIYLRAL